MERDPEVLVRLEDVQERKVAVLVRLLEDAVEIPDRLMIMQDETEMNVRLHERRSVPRGENPAARRQRPAIVFDRRADEEAGSELIPALRRSRRHRRVCRRSVAESSGSA
jgi:hypothetical protein